MRFTKSPVYLLAASSLLFTSAFAADSAAMTLPEPLPTPDVAKQPSDINDESPLNPEPELKKRAIVDAPPDPVPKVPTQVSPVMTVWVQGVQVLYTQTFPPTPDPWPAPKSGEIGLGTLMGEIGKTTTIKARSLPTDGPEAMFARQCRTLECRKNVENLDKRDEESDA
ncbi:hypothetical protein MaudCBS49596_006542 [Microsporum audouinii]